MERIPVKIKMLKMKRICASFFLNLKTLHICLYIHLYMTCHDNCIIHVVLEFFFLLDFLVVSAAIACSVDLLSLFFTVFIGLLVVKDDLY